MAGYGAVAASGRSLERLLNKEFMSEPSLADVLQATPRAVVVRTEDFDPDNQHSLIVRPAVSIYLYRVEYNTTMRASWSGVGHRDGRSHLPLDLHFLVTAWGDNSEHEQLLLGRTLQILEELPILTGPMLYATGDWAAGDAVQVIMENVSTDEVLRTWESLANKYRLSVAYVARIIRIDGRTATPSADASTVATGMVPSLS
jgi:hypothetical protein